MARRDYQQSGVSDEDDAWIRSFVIHEDEALLAFNKPA